MAKESAENIQKLKSCWDAGDGACVARLGAQIELDEKAYTELRQQDNTVGRAYEDSAKWYADVIENCNGECGWLSAHLQKNFADGTTALVYGALASSAGVLPVSKSGTTVKVPNETIKNVTEVSGAVKNTPLVTRGADVTPEIILKALQGDSGITAQARVSLPMIQRYVDRLLAGDTAPAIKMDGNVIIDGNHRYIAAKILGREPEVVSGVLSPNKIDLTKPVSNIIVEPVDWGGK